MEDTTRRLGRVIAASCELGTVYIQQQQEEGYDQRMLGLELHRCALVLGLQVLACGPIWLIILHLLQSRC